MQEEQLHAFHENALAIMFFKYQLRRASPGVTEPYLHWTARASHPMEQFQSLFCCVRFLAHLHLDAHIIRDGSRS